jgi:hypothetical protein
MKVDDSDLEQPLDMPEAAPHTRAHPQPKPNKRKPFKLIIAILLIAALGLAIWRLTKKEPKQTPSTPHVTVPASHESSRSDFDIPTTTETKTYENSPMRAEITYPKNWTVTESDFGFTVTSPSFNFETTDKGTAKGNFTVYIRQGARDVDGKYIGAGVTIKPTDTLTYKAPGVGQRTTTNFTQFGADTKDHFTFFMITGDFNLKPGDTLGPNYGKEASTFIIAGGYKADGLKDDLAYSNVKLDYYASTTAYKQAVDIVKSLKITG